MNIPEYVKCYYEERLIYSAHPVTCMGKAAEFAKLLQTENGWCFYPIPIVDCGFYYQAIDGTHRLEAARQTNRKPEVVIVNALIHPDQPIPKEYKWKSNSYMVLDRIICVYEEQSTKQKAAIMLLSGRNILRIDYVKFLLDFISQLGSQIPLLSKDKQNG